MRNSNRGPAFLILFATLMAAAGDGVSIVAFPWLVLQREGSAGQASIVASATMLPLLFATLVAGTAVDYFGRRRVSMVADALSGAAVAGVPLVAWGYGGDAVNVLVLAVLAALAAAFGPAGMTARDSMLPEAAARAGWSLDRINGAYEAILNLAFIVGPAIGGLMIATVGGITTMWITATAFGCPSSRLPPCNSRVPASRTTPRGPKGWYPGSPRGCASSGTCGYCAPSG